MIHWDLVHWTLRSLLHYQLTEILHWINTLLLESCEYSKGLYAEFASWTGIPMTWCGNWQSGGSVGYYWDALG